MGYRDDRSGKFRKWEKVVDGVGFRVDKDRGALWTGIGAAAALRLAGERGLTTLESTPEGGSLDHGKWKSELDTDFGPDYVAEKRRIFTLISDRFVAALSGRVFAFLPEDLTAPERGAPGSYQFYAKILWRELMHSDFGDPRSLNPKITELYILTVRDGAVSGSYPMPSSPHLH